MKNIIFKISNRVWALVLCLCMALGTLSMFSCNDPDETPEDDTSSDGEEYVEVLRVIDEIKFGGKFTNDRLATVKVRTDAVPDGAVSDIADVRNKYAATHFYPGDFVTTAKMLDKKPEGAEEDDEEGITEIDPYELGYVLITKYSEFKDGQNYSPAIKKAIEENPGRTIYFPDGTYNICEPIVIPADPEKSVSLRLSNYAVITAADWEDPLVPMVRVGVGEEETDTGSADGSSVSMEDAGLSSLRSTFIIGGCFYGSSKASGIYIEGGKDTLIYNVSIKRTYHGIRVFYGPNETGATYVNVDNVNITGYEATGSAGVFVEGTHNTFSNMRIASVQYGVLCSETGEGNIFRNLHPLTVGMNDVIKVDENGKRLEEDNGRHTVGFYDKSNGNNFDVCYSDQMASGYMFEENTRTVVIGGFCFWWTKNNDYHVGYESTGKFNSIVVSGRVSLDGSTSMNTYIYVGESGGQGIVISPIGARNDKFSDMLNEYVRS